MKEFGFVNFEENKDLDIEKARINKLSELMGIDVEELENYEIISLHPMTEIIANEFQKDFVNYRTFTSEELKNEKIFRGDLDILGDARTVLQMKDVLIEKYIERIIPISSSILDDIAMLMFVVLHPFSDIPIVNWPHRTEIIVVVPKSSGLLDKEFKTFTDAEYNETKDFLYEKNLIRVRND